MRCARCKRRLDKPGIPGLGAVFGPVCAERLGIVAQARTGKPAKRARGRKAARRDVSGQLDLFEEMTP
jgi:hypothetical protein